MRSLGHLNLSHGFIDRWHPSKPLKLARHPGEPSVFELIVALCFLVDWDSQYRPKMTKGGPALSAKDLPNIDLRLHEGRRITSGDDRVFEEEVFRLATVPLIKMGLGSWSDEGGFELIFSLRGERPIDLADTYYETRHNIAKRLGGEENSSRPSDPTIPVRADPAAKCNRLSRIVSQDMPGEI